jgi:hypothetical protein
VTRSIPWQRILAEFGAIFAGVTLGLLAEGWWQHRGDTAAAMELLAEVHEDLRADSIQLALLTSFSRGYDENATRLVRMLPDPDSDVEGLSTSVEGLSIYYTYQPVSAGYVAIRDAGHLADIPDPALRRSIVEYYEERQVSMQYLWTDVLEIRDDFVRASRRHFVAVVPDSATGMNQRSGLRLASTRSALASDQDLRGIAEIQGIHSAVMVEGIIPPMMAENRRIGASIRALGVGPDRVR